LAGAEYTQWIGDPLRVYITCNDGVNIHTALGSTLSEAV